MTASSTFCYCIPTRLGVLLLAPFTFLLSLTLSVLLFYGVGHFWDRLEDSQHAMIIILGLIMIFLAFGSISGFVGAFLGRRALVRCYNGALWFAIASATVFGIVNYALAWHYRNDFARVCRRENRGPRGYNYDECKDEFFRAFYISLSFWILVVLVSIYLANIVRKYSRQLQHENVHYENGVAPTTQQTREV